MGGQRAASGALALAAALGLDGFDPRLRARERLAQVLEDERELILVELLGSRAEAVPLEGLNDRGQSRNLGLGLRVSRSVPGSFGLGRHARRGQLGDRHPRLCVGGAQAGDFAP